LQAGFGYETCCLIRFGKQISFTSVGLGDKKSRRKIQRLPGRKKTRAETDAGMIFWLFVGKKTLRALSSPPPLNARIIQNTNNGS
jgi:hypothetical protein